MGYALQSEVRLAVSLTLGVGLLLGCSDDPPPENAESVPSAACSAIEASITNAGFANSVTVFCNETHAYIASDVYPDHTLMNGITATNEQLPVPASGYAAPIPLYPARANNTTTIDNAVGIAVNGVPIYDYSSQGELNVDVYDASVDTILLGQLDVCGGHAGRGDDYHYHQAPNCMIDAMANQGDDAILGWGFDGYPIYGYRTPTGQTIAEGDLDTCNGMNDDTYGHRYHATDYPPYFVECLVGEVDTTILPRVQPLDGRTTGTPPQGGVENMLFEQLPDGTRRMSYTYNGEEYYTSYKESQTENCYDFELKMVTTNGQVESAEYCRPTEDGVPSTNGGGNGGAGPGPNDDSFDCDETAPAGFTLASSTIDRCAAMPVANLCSRDDVGGSDLSPPLNWTHAPANAGSYAVAMYHFPNGANPDTDTPSHYWLLWNLPASTTALAEGNPSGVGTEGSDKDGSQTPELGYTPPCSPADSTGAHWYTMKVFALSGNPTSLGTQDDDSVGYTEFMAGISGLVLDEADFSFYVGD